MDPYAFRAEMGLTFAATDPRGHVKVTGITTPPIGPLLDKLREEHPDDYANLSEHICVEDFRE